MNTLQSIKKQAKRKNAKNINHWDFYNFISRLGYAVVETGTIKNKDNKKVSHAMCIDKNRDYLHNRQFIKLKPVKLETLEKIIKYYYGDLIKFKKTYCQYAPEIKKAWLCCNFT